MQKIAFFLFCCATGLFVYLYGIASSKKQWFPATIIEDGWRAAEALHEVWQSNLSGLPPGALNIVYDAPRLQQISEITVNRDHSEDLLLITGGPFKLMQACPDLGCLAWLMDRSGAIYHAWPIDPKIQWGDSLKGEVKPSNITPIGAHAYDNGDLLVTFQGRNTFPFGVGVARVDIDGKLIWQLENNAHHWFDVDDDGQIYLATHRLIESPLKLGDTNLWLKCEDGQIYEDFVVILDPHGNIIEEFSLFDVFIDSGYAGLIELTRSTCDPLHLNDVRVLTSKDAGGYPDFAAGDILISTNAVNAVAVLDSATKQIKWLTSGRMIAQHNPRFAGGNSILVFDNRGGKKIENQVRSRIIKIDVSSDQMQVLFPKPHTQPSVNFHTDVAGQFDFDQARDRALVALSLRGRILEIDLKSGEVLWEYDEVQDIGEYLRAKDDDDSKPFARFSVNGAFYADRPAFLD